MSIRLGIIFVVAALVVGAPVAWAATADRDSTPDGPAAAPITVPAQMPTEDVVHEMAYGYVSSEKHARDIRKRSGAPASGATSGSSATITVTAIVLPTRTIRTENGKITEIISNTEKTGARDAMYVFTGADNQNIPITEDLWAQARAAMADATASAPGTVWSAS